MQVNYIGFADSITVENKVYYYYYYHYPTFDTLYYWYFEPGTDQSRVTSKEIV